VQLALNVTNLESAVDFYTKLFDAPPSKVRPGYANWALAEPPLKLVLVESAEGGTLNHLGVEVASPTEVSATTTRLAEEGLDTKVEDDVTCCYATMDKVWVKDPDGAPWEVYTVTDDNPAPAAEVCGPGCC
jgi:catechol 2,3-dioxygenase-like lactoylglutathione lyase family enzyme